MNENIKALNRAFERAFAHTTTRKSLADLLDCLGRELTCDRISIFEANASGTCDNTYEWCRESTFAERDIMQNISLAQFGSWSERLERDEIIIIRELEDIRTAEPALYDMLHAQDIHSVIVSKLAFHGSSLGFFILENPAGTILDDADEILPGMRYILSSLVYSDHLVHKLEKVGYSDVLTGTGNRLSLHEHLESIDRNKSIGIFYCDVIGWERSDNRPEHFDDEQMLLHTSHILRSIFDEDSVFRVGVNEFCVLCSDTDEDVFLETVTLAKNLFHQKDILVASGIKWAEKCGDDCDSLIRSANLLSYEAKKEIDEMPEPTPAHKHYEIADIGLSLANISLYYGDEFFEKASVWLSGLFDKNAAAVVVDINYFKLYNDIFGRKAGKLFLENIAESIRALAQRCKGVSGYFGGDNFCVLLPTDADSPEKLLPLLKEEFSHLEYVDGFSPVLGVYLSTDRRDSAVTLYDRALTALAEIRGSYTEHIHFYNEEHFKNIRENKLLLIEAKKAIPKGEFIFYVQPKVNVRTGRIIGGEALVRWLHKGQLLSPGRFIEAMENSGYIFALDCYIWEEVCKWQRSLTDRGIEPLPCSINVSRVDFYFTDVAAYIIGLVEKYGISPELIGVEITETAFTDNLDSIMEAVSRLHDAGFSILMDDFGCGSSSLSMLHTMQLDVLKTDVMFMRRSDSDQKAISIVESVISMAHMIGMIVVTEGVETENQRNSLLSLGDNYAQGYYFYKPMPVSEYEALISDVTKVGKPPKKSDRIKIEELHLHKNSFNETFLESIDAPAAIYKETAEGCTLIQSNDSYLQKLGFNKNDTEKIQKHLESFHSTAKSNVEYILHGADTVNGTADAANKVYLLYTCDDHSMYLSILNDQKI